VKPRVWILLGATAASIIAVFLFPAIPQSEAYHNFADKRTIFSVPNFLNVISNALFLVIGIRGMRDVLGASRARSLFIDPRERWAYFLFFVGVTFTAFGSSYYHLNPNDRTLLWDRLPMAIGFMALVGALISERISVKAGVLLILPLVAAGAATVVYWEITQARGHGDLRAYGVAQFGSLLVLLLILVLFPARYARGSDFVIALALYGVAKIFEAVDKPVFALVRIVSGHTIKHVFAALSAYWVLRMLNRRTAVNREPASTALVR
jgi:Ceramidase